MEKNTQGKEYVPRGMNNTWRGIDTEGSTHRKEYTKEVVHSEKIKHGDEYRRKGIHMHKWGRIHTGEIYSRKGVQAESCIWEKRYKEKDLMKNLFGMA